MRTLFQTRFQKYILACASMMLLAVCPRSSALPDEPFPGGAEHKITRIWILDRANTTLMEEENRSTLHVGEQMPLRVMAGWAIPYVEDVTSTANLTVDKTECGELDTNTGFMARKPGKIVIQATLRVAQHPDSEVLSPTESAGKDPVQIFDCHMELNITQ